MQMLDFRQCLETIQRFEWDGNQKYGSVGTPVSPQIYTPLKNDSPVLIYMEMFIPRFLRK